MSTVGALEGIERPISNCTDLFVHLVVELLDAKTRREWENSLGKTSEPPSYEELREFLQEQLMTQEVLRAVTGEATGKSDKSGRAARANHVRSRGPDSSRSCPLCRKEHFLAFCEAYKKKSAQDRRDIVTTHQRCWNCLGRHVVSECPSSKNCSKCSGRHHTSLHEVFPASTAVAIPVAGTSSTPTVHVAKRPAADFAAVLLATARVLVTDRVGVRHVVRALIDPGSEASLMAESLAQRLRLPRTPTSVAVFGVGGVQTGSPRGRVSVKLSSRSEDFSITVSSLVLPRLTLYNGVMESGARSWPHVRDIELADPEFYTRDPVELLLGADVYADVVLPDLRRGGPLEPVAQRTRLGWILLGAVGSSLAASTVTSLQCSPSEDLATAVRRFWEWEEPPSVALPLSTDDRECEDHFRRTHQRRPDGRYQVRLPVRPELPNLVSTRRAALRMLGVMERRFERDADFRDKYQRFMDEYLSLGHMEAVPSEHVGRDDRTCFLPHHGVMRGSGPDAKIRVVFNGSSRAATGSSLNDALLTGPNLLPALADVVMRWRRHRYVFVADVEKMYRQILVHPEDRSLQRITWRAEGQVRDYNLTTVTYGMACAPYLAMRVMRQLASDDGARFPLGAEALRTDVYMDDVLTGASTLELSRHLRTQVSSLCMAGGFPLKKWAANHETLLEDVPPEHRMQSSTDAWLPSVDHSVLGLRWSPVVAEIQRASLDAQWRHVPGRDNPADCASRGISPRELLDHPLWWQGPGFLLTDPPVWPTDPSLPDHDDLPDQRPTRCLAAVDAREPTELTRFSSLRRLLRVSAWIGRWRKRRPVARRPPSSPAAIAATPGPRQIGVSATPVDPSSPSYCILPGAEGHTGRTASL
ncbi:hypothetical protein RF55_17211 [Lasius niger]|uniref:Peptidase A2 domain-containing protein n=1 Tax=Lasius niger TaxID=67767 RepID=A0A0J7K2T2_LASNI|nr:hypothetical protein RF55_17211 [Lasius niger]